MKEINFYDGGMPIHLDDLKLLQSFSKDVVVLLIKSLVGEKVEAFAMNLPKVKRAPEGGVIVSPGAMYVDGDILSWNETQVADIIEGMPVYACIREVTSDNRLFADGQEHPCRIEKEVYFSSSKDGVAKAYDITIMPILADLLEKNVEEGDWVDIGNGHLYNGYAGKARARAVNKRTRIQFNLMSDETSWREPYELNGKQLYLVCNVVPRWEKAFLKGIEVKTGYLNKSIGTLKWAPGSPVLIFEPISSTATPQDCPIILDITL